MFRIAWKDIRHNFRSPFSLIMMFAAPLLITALLYFAFGPAGGDSEGSSIPASKIFIVNRDSPPPAAGAFAAGQLLVSFLSDEDLSVLVAISEADGEAGALEQVSTGNAAVALVIPTDFTSAVLTGDQRSEVAVLHDPALSIGPQIVGSLVQHFIDGFAGSAIAVKVAARQRRARGEPSAAELQPIVRKYSAWLQSEGHGESGETLRVATPSGRTVVGQTGFSLVGPTMAGMLIFFVFFMEANGASSNRLLEGKGNPPSVVTDPGQSAGRSSVFSCWRSGAFVSNRLPSGHIASLETTGCRTRCKGVQRERRPDGISNETVPRYDAQRAGEWNGPPGPNRGGHPQHLRFPDALRSSAGFSLPDH